MWAFTGGCHYDENCGLYSENCGKCPILNSKNEKDLSYKVLRRKKRAWRDLNLTIVTPSHWLAKCARASALFHDQRIEVIPNGLDLKVFQPIDKHFAQNLLSLPQGKKFILFGAFRSMDKRRKGFHLLQPALQELARNTAWNTGLEMIIFGVSEPYNPPDLGLKTHYMGYLHDDISLAILYSAANVMVVPSVQEAFGQTALEAIACGTPVVAFHTTGLIDIIEHMKTGYLAKPFDSNDLANGITWILSDNERWQTLSQQERQKVENEFAQEHVAQRYASLYEEILGHKK
jgi:glycosyltransferase involved in cell wall biosynthesis